jgi:hypothetical protein
MKLGQRSLTGILAIFAVLIAGLVVMPSWIQRAGNKTATAHLDAVSSYQAPKQTEQTPILVQPLGLTPDNFLKEKHLDVQFSPKKFKVDVPEDWSIKLGEYPVGLYWKLANVLSNDAGLDLSPLHGQIVEVWQYELRGGLPNRDQKSEFKYPTNVILLVKSEKVVGAWLNFNVQNIGPSVNKRYLDEITGISYEQWVDKEVALDSKGPNRDLDKMTPTEVLTTFFDAVQQGKTARANACLSWQRQLESLTVNLEPDHLYNPGYGDNNSLVANIVSVQPISYNLIDHENGKEISSIADRTDVIVQVSLQIKWKNTAFNNPSGKETRFAYMIKSSNGWKLGGLGTGP